MAKQVIDISTANSGQGTPLRSAFDMINDNFTELYTDDAGDVNSITATAPIARDSATGAVTISLLDNGVTNAKLENRYKAQVAISTLTGTVAFDFSAGSSFKLSGDLTGAYTINITNYKKGQVATIFPLKAQSVTLTGGSGTGVFNKLGGVDYDNSATSILQIECVDDQATNPVFFYSVATFAADSTI
tara:strand:+ start:62 stop:625 length:564 start_codon:yes stop_codon:yes gene_type:complete